MSLRGVGIFAGFGAAGLLSVSMLLMLRSTQLDRAFGGLGNAYQVHHAFGVAALVLLLVHPLVLALAALQLQPQRALALLWPNPSSVVVFSGWIALLLFLVFFVITIAPCVSFRCWRFFHRASGLAYAAMVWHLVVAWSGSIATAFGLILVLAGVLGFLYRLLAQDPPWRGLRYRVVEVHRRTPELVDIVLEPLGEPLRFDAGQFVYMALRDSPGYRACGELHPYTMTNPPDEPRLRLSIKALGDCTRHIQELSAGAEAIIKGPFGGMFPESARGRAQLWIAGGIGVTPFLSRAASLDTDSPPVDIIYAAVNEEAALYLEELRTLASGRTNMHVHTIFEDSDGLPTVAAVEALVGTINDKDVMLAGPRAMVRALTVELRARGIAASRIHSEEGVLR
jgi:predicted ferric reductase